MSDQDRDNPRREFLRKSLTLIPVVTLAGSGSPTAHREAETAKAHRG